MARRRWTVVGRLPAGDFTRGHRRRSPMSTAGRGPSDRVSSKGSDRIVVLFRVVDPIGRTDSSGLGGLPARCRRPAAVWIEGVRPGDSVALLESLAVAPNGSTRVTDGAVMAIALHGDDSADTALDRLVAHRPARDSPQEGDVLARQRPGAAGVRSLLRSARRSERRGSKERDLRPVAEPDPGSHRHVASIARSDREPRLRSEALFWLAQKAGHKAAADDHRPDRCRIRIPR